MVPCYVHILKMCLMLLALIQGACVNFMHHCLFYLSIFQVSLVPPHLSLFLTTMLTEIWTAKASVFSIVNTSTNSLGKLVADLQVVGQLAGATNRNGYLSSINTDYTACDMLRITKAYGQDKIQYWGIS